MIDSTLQKAHPETDQSLPLGLRFGGRCRCLCLNAGWCRAHVRRPTAYRGGFCTAARAHARRLSMDVAGPKLRTGPIAAETQVVKCAPQRDVYGRVAVPAHIWLTPTEHPQEPLVPADGTLRVSEELLAQARNGDAFVFSDLRGKSRTLKVAGGTGRSR